MGLFFGRGRPKKENAEIKIGEIKAPEPPIEAQEKPVIKDYKKYIIEHRNLVHQIKKLEFDFYYALAPLRRKLEDIEQLMENIGLSTDQVEDNRSEALKELGYEIDERK